MSLQAIGSYVILKPNTRPEQTAGGLYIPDSSRDAHPTTGRIVSVGDGGELPEEVEGLKVGDEIVFPWTAGRELEVDGEKYLVLNAKDVMAVVEPETSTGSPADLPPAHPTGGQ